MTGVVLSWNISKRFGWIRPDAGPQDVFAHADDVMTHDELVGAPALRRGQAVRFTLVDRGRGTRAVAVRVLGEPAPLERAH